MRVIHKKEKKNVRKSFCPNATRSCSLLYKHNLGEKSLLYHLLFPFIPFSLLFPTYLIHGTVTPFLPLINFIALTNRNSRLYYSITQRNIHWSCRYKKKKNLTASYMKLKHQLHKLKTPKLTSNREHFLPQRCCNKLWKQTRSGWQIVLYLICISVDYQLTCHSRGQINCRRLLVPWCLQAVMYWQSISEKI